MSAEAPKLKLQVGLQLDLCPTEEDLILFASGRLARDPERFAKVEEHLDRCADCMDVVVALARVGSVA
jgi:hypothetical protein